MSRPAIDLAGQRFGRWLVLHRAPKAASTRAALWLCRCDCGVEKPVNGQSLRRLMTTSCGCRRIEVLQTPERREAQREISRRIHARRKRLVGIGLDAWSNGYGEQPVRRVEYKTWKGMRPAALELAAALGYRTGR